MSASMLLMILFQEGFVCSPFGDTGTNTERVCTPTRNLHAYWNISAKRISCYLMRT